MTLGITNTFKAFQRVSESAQNTSQLQQFVCDGFRFVKFVYEGLRVSMHISSTIREA